MHLEQHTEPPAKLSARRPVARSAYEIHSSPAGSPAQGKPQKFPDPVFPQYPELIGPIDMNDGWVPPDETQLDARTDLSRDAGLALPLHPVQSHSRRLPSADLLTSSQSSNAISTATTAGPSTTK